MVRKKVPQFKTTIAVTLTLAALIAPRVVCAQSQTDSSSGLMQFVSPLALVYGLLNVIGTVAILKYFRYGALGKADGGTR